MSMALAVLAAPSFAADRLNVVATTGMIADAARQVGGDLVEGLDRRRQVGETVTGGLSESFGPERRDRQGWVGDLEGHLVTSRWTARRKGEKSIEVRYHYTVLVEDDVPERRGYAWIYDELVEQVIGPRELDRSQASSITNQRKVGQQFSRHRQHTEDTLE